MPATPPVDSNPAPPRPIRRWGIATIAMAQIVLCLALFLIVNFLSYRHYKRFDISPSRDYSLSEMTVNNLRKLTKDVTITLIFTRDSDIMKDARTLAEEYRRVKKNRIHIEEVDPARDIERAEQLKIQNGIVLHGNGILVRANDHNRFIPEEELIINGLEGDRERPSLDFRGEEAMTSAIISLVEGGVRKFYCVVGKGTASGRDATPSFAALTELGRQQNIETSALNLTDVTEIPADASGIVLLGSRYDLDEREMSMLKNYWQGKRAAMLVLLDPNGETPRLRDFLAANGVTPRPDRVLHAESTVTGPHKEFSVQTVFLNSSPISRPFNAVAARLGGQSQSLDVRGDTPELLAQHVAAIPIMDATDRFWATRDYLNELPVIGPADTKPPVHLAASIERGFVSDERLRMDSSRMVVVGNAELLNPELRLAVHQDFVSACLNWMLNREHVTGIPPKRKQIFRIELTEKQRKSIFQITALLLPGTALALGFLLSSHRRS